MDDPSASPQHLFRQYGNGGDGGGRLNMKIYLGEWRRKPVKDEQFYPTVLLLY